MPPNKRQIVSEEKRIKALLAQSLQKKAEMQDLLPHLYSPLGWYQWAWDFFQTENRLAFLCAGNQVSKSSTLIRRTIRFATETESWGRWWPTKPSLFWYFYPDYRTIEAEWECKWKAEWLPRGEMMKHPKYGWKLKKVDGKISGLSFNTGVHVNFQQYEKSITNLQSGSVYFLALDEECPEIFWPELSARVSAPTVQGFIAGAFTATIGQEFWREVIEEKGQRERFPSAFKRQVSVIHDCRTYMDGSPSPWTDEVIAGAIARCKSPQEIDRRIHGRFVKDDNLQYGGFVRDINYVKPDGPPLPEWTIWSAVDPGSGGDKNHPAAMLFLAVNLNFTEGRVFRARRMDGIQTTASDILMEYERVRGALKPIAEVYDPAGKDFGIISIRHGDRFKFRFAQKGHELGINLVNTLFKNKMLFIDDTGDEELEKLVHELMNVSSTSFKLIHQLDDLSDCLRYVLAEVPWDFSHVGAEQTKEKIEEALSDRERLWRGLDRPNAGLDLLEREFDEWNEAYEYLGYDE